MYNNSINIVKSSEVLGVNVKNRKLEDLGKVDEIVLDKFSGEAKYIVISFGGFLGFGDKLFAFPWRSIEYSPQHNCFILNVDQKLLEEGNGFDKDHWPDMKTWTTTVDRYYHV